MLTTRTKNILTATIAVVIAAIVIGCGGSSVQRAAPTGDAAVRSSSLGSYQSLNAGIAFPFTALQISAPGGAGIDSKGAKRTGGLTLNPALNLYATEPITTSNGAVIKYYTDAAGTIPAGSMSLVSSTGSFTYTTYPASITLTINVTAGNLPCHGSAKIAYTGPSGGNTLTGSLTLPKNNETLSINLALSDTAQVTGTMSVSENSTTIQAVNVSGALTGPLAFNFTLMPQNYVGTGTIDLFTGALTLTFTNPSHASCSVDSSGDLVIDYPDGTTETITNPLTAGLLGSTSSTNTTGSTVTTATATTTGTNSPYTMTPVLGSPTSITAVSTDGRMVGNVGINTSRIPMYWSSPTVQPQAVALGSTYTDIFVQGVNTSGALVGIGFDSNQNYVPLYWSSASQPPVELTFPSGVTNLGSEGGIFINASGKIIVNVLPFGQPVDVSYLYQSSTDTNPAPLQGGYVSGYSDANVALGGNTNGQFVVWSPVTATATPIVISQPISPSIKNAAIGANGTVMLDDEGTNIVYSIAGPSYAAALVLQTPPNLKVIGANGVGPTGDILGTVATDSTSLDNDGLIWTSATAAPTILRAKNTPNVIYADFQTATGLLIVTTVPTPGVPEYEFQVMTPN